MATEELVRPQRVNDGALTSGNQTGKAPPAICSLTTRSGTARKTESKLDRLRREAWEVLQQRGEAQFYISSDKEDAAGEWITVCQQHKGRGRPGMRGPDAADVDSATPPPEEGDGRGTKERRPLAGRRDQGGPVGQQEGSTRS